MSFRNREDDLLTPLQNFLTSLFSSVQPIIPLFGGLGLLMYGGYLILGNHTRAREGIICALLGTAIMLGAQTMAAAVHA